MRIIVSKTEPKIVRSGSKVHELKFRAEYFVDKGQSMRWLLTCYNTFHMMCVELTILTIC